MKWRCPKCGKPHENNDPPCDNCSHHKFERAVVPTASADPDHEQFVWACTECGRHHQRNNPPCSRCGNATFEKKPLDYDEFDPGSSASYLDLAGRLEIGAALVVVALVAVGVLGYLGVINVPGLTPQGPPNVENVPGDADTVGDLPLSEVETAVLAELNTDRSPRLERSGGLDDLATYVNQRFVKNAYTDEDREISRDQIQRFDLQCSDRVFAQQAETANAVAGGTEPETIALGLLSQLAAVDSSDSVERVGIDAHAGPDDRVFVTVAYCQTGGS